jgi:hypothetical protein
MAFSWNALHTRAAGYDNHDQKKSICFVFAYDILNQSTLGLQITSAHKRA